MAGETQEAVRVRSGVYSPPAALQQPKTTTTRPSAAGPPAGRRGRQAKDKAALVPAANSALKPGHPLLAGVGGATDSVDRYYVEGSGDVVAPVRRTGSGPVAVMVPQTGSSPDAESVTRQRSATRKQAAVQVHKSNRDTEDAEPSSELDNLVGPLGGLGSGPTT